MEEQDDTNQDSQFYGNTPLIGPSTPMPGGATRGADKLTFSNSMSPGLALTPNSVDQAGCPFMSFHYRKPYGGLVYPSPDGSDTNVRTTPFHMLDCQYYSAGGPMVNLNEDVGLRKGVYDFRIYKEVSEYSYLYGTGPTNMALVGTESKVRMYNILQGDGAITLSCCGIVKNVNFYTGRESL